MVLETHSEVETWEVAKLFATSLNPGDVVCLEGDLGAGKTTFTQGLCAALGARRAVTSPTFCIVSEHPAERFLVVHMDLGGVLNDLPVDGVSDIVLDGNDNGLVHLVADDATHAGFSQVTFFGHDSVPLMHSFRGEWSSRERYRA